MEQAILFVMEFYGVSKEDALKYYQDEIESYVRLKEQFEAESE